MPSIMQRIKRAFTDTSGEAPLRRFTPHEFMKWWRDIGLPHPFKAKESLQSYGDNPWLYSAVNVIASEIARTDLFLQREAKEDEIEKVKKHQAMETLKRPMPVGTNKTHMTQKQLMFLTAQHMLLNGEAFWLADGRARINGAPTILEPLNPGNIKLHFNSANEIDAYEYDIYEDKRFFDPMDVVHFKLMNPEDWFRGASPTKPIRWAIDTSKEADILNYKRLVNNAIPGGFLKTDKNVDEEVGKRILSSWKKLYKGSENANKVALLPNNLTFEKVQESNADMQFSEAKERYRDEILANFRVGLEMLGRTESQTRANADAAIYVFMRFSILPMLEMIVDTLNYDYLPMFPGTDGLTFGYDDPVPENTEEKRANVTALMDNGALTPNEARRMFGLEDLDNEGADIPYINFNKVPLGFSPPDPANLAA
jgi:HK97 family phage portal protein